jgi:hypothetical protein
MPILHHPVPYEVIQRRLDNTALVEVRGECRPGSRKVMLEVSAAGRARPRSPIGGSWFIIPKRDGTFAGQISLAGGWYRLKATEIDESVQEARVAQVEPFGVGEVFLTWGHSIAAGDENGNDGAKDPRVTAPVDQNDEADVERLSFRFQHLGAGKPIGPFQKYPAQWALLGDRLTRRLQVPVAFYGAAFGGEVLLNRIIKPSSGSPLSIHSFATTSGCLIRRSVPP